MSRRIPNIQDGSLWQREAVDHPATVIRRDFDERTYFRDLTAELWSDWSREQHCAEYPPASTSARDYLPVLLRLRVITVLRARS